MASVDERLEMLVGESDSDSDSLSSFSSNETDYDDELIYNDQYEDTINQYYTERDGNAQDGVPQQIGLFTVNTDKKSYICYDATDKFLIDCAKKEYKAVVRMVEIATQKDVNDERACPYELFKVFFPHTMITSMIKWIDEYSPSAKKIRVTCSDIKAFIRLDLKIQYYNTSCSHMYEHDQRKHYRLGEYMNENTYHYIMRALKNGRKTSLTNQCNASSTNGSMTRKEWLPPIHRNPEMIALFQEFGRNCAKVGFISGVSMIALDDDLWRHRSKSVVADGATQINNPKKGMGVVHHAAVSVTTGIYCGGYVQHRGDTTMLCVTNVQQILCSAISTNEMHLNGTIFFMDRGYGGTDGEIVQSLIQRGGNIHGTAKRMRSFLYTYGQENVGPNQVLVSESGAYSVYES